MTGICPQCSDSFEIIPGHRRRRYCSERCKQTAYRRRCGQQAQPVSAHERERRQSDKRLDQIEKRWPGLSLGTYYLLEEIQRNCGQRLVDKVAERILWEVQHNGNAERSGM